MGCARSRRGALACLAALAWCLARPGRGPSAAFAAAPLPGRPRARAGARGTGARGVGALGPQRARVRRAALPEASFLDVAAFLQQLPEQVAAMGPLGALYFLGVFVLSQCLVVIPITPLIMSSAYVFQAPLSYVVASFGVVASAAAGFFLARFMLRSQVQEMFKDDAFFRKVSLAVKQEGFKICFLLRLSAVIPSPILSFMFGGLTSVDFKDFILASLLASVPEGWAIVYLADTARDAFSSENTPWYVYAFVAVVVAALLHTIAEIAQRVLDETIEDGRAAGAAADAGAHAAEACYLPATVDSWNVPLGSLCTGTGDGFRWSPQSLEVLSKADGRLRAELKEKAEAIARQTEAQEVSVEVVSSLFNPELAVA